jgi:hypothetical protein
MSLLGRIDGRMNIVSQHLNNYRQSLAEELGGKSIIRKVGSIGVQTQSGDAGSIKLCQEQIAKLTLALNEWQAIRDIVLEAK